MNEQIGELLVKENLLTAEQLREARDEARSHGRRVGAQITQLGYLNENELTDFIAKQYGVPSIDLAGFEIDEAVIRLIALPPEQGRPVPVEGGQDSLSPVAPWRVVNIAGGQPAELRDMQRDLVPADGLLLIYEVGDNASHVFVVPPLGEELAVDIADLEPGSLIVLVAGLPIGVTGGTNLLRVLTVSASP